MAITKIVKPSLNPSSPSDYLLQNEYIFALLAHNNAPVIPFSTDGAKPRIMNGAYISHLGELYQADVEESISGTFSDGDKCLIRLTESSGVLTASFVKSTSGYAYNYEYGQYLNSSNQQLLPFFIERDGSKYTTIRTEASGLKETL